MMVIAFMLQLSGGKNEGWFVIVKGVVTFDMKAETWVSISPQK